MSIATEITRLQTAKADLKTAIEGKGVTVPSATKIDGYADLVDSIPSGGGGYSIADIAERNISGNLIIDSVITTPYVFYNCTGITSVKLTSNSPGSSSNGWWFYGCSNMVSLDAPLSIEIGRSSCQNCTSLQSLSLPSVKYISNSCFSNCRSLVAVAFPSAIGAYASSFAGCSNLEAVDLGGCDINEYSVFNNCTKLNTLIIRKSTVGKLNNINSFNGTPFASNGSGGTLYVPQSLISSYQSATNWSTILGYTNNNNIAAIEGSQYENYYADGTPIT